MALLYDIYGEENYIDGIIASVNNMPILYSDVKNVAMAMKYDKSNSKTISEVDILKDLIDQNLIISSEPNISLDKEAQFIEKGVREQANMIFEKYFQNDEKSFIKQLGCNLEDYIKVGITNQKKQMLYKRILDSISQKEFFSYEEVGKFYNYLKKENKLPTVQENYNIYQIVLLQKPSETVREIVTAVAGDLKNKSFDEVAENRSKYKGLEFEQDSSWKTLNDLNAEFESVVFGLKPGEVSQPVRIDDFIYFIRLDALDKEKYKTSMLYICDNIYKLNQQAALDDLEIIKNNILSGKLTWIEAVKLFSQDNKKNLYGQVFNDKGSTSLQKTDLSLQLRHVLKQTKKHTISAPFIDNTTDGNVFKIIYVKDHIEKHTACMEDDYALLEELTRQQYKKEKKRKMLLGLYNNTDIKLNEHHPICIQLKEKYKTLFR